MRNLFVAFITFNLALIAGVRGGEPFDASVFSYRPVDVSALYRTIVAEAISRYRGDERYLITRRLYFKNGHLEKSWELCPALDERVFAFQENRLTLQLPVRTQD